MGTATCQHHTIAISSTRTTEFVDLTDRLHALVEEARLQTGLVNIQSRHTTTAILVNEHEPLLLEDFCDLLVRTAPTWGPYRHDNLAVRTVNVMPGERPNGYAHCRALLLPPSVSLNVAGGRLQLGRWQRLFLVELDGPQNREVSVLLMGDAAA